MHNCMKQPLEKNSVIELIFSQVSQRKNLENSYKIQHDIVKNSTRYPTGQHTVLQEVNLRHKVLIIDMYIHFSSIDMLFSGVMQ